MIFNFLEKAPHKEYINLKTLKADIHSHLLPGMMMALKTFHILSN